VLNDPEVGVHASGFDEKLHQGIVPLMLIEYVETAPLKGIRLAFYDQSFGLGLWRRVIKGWGCRKCNDGIFLISGRYGN
jgi:hypothetical protein